MVADIFYAILTLNITVLVCFIQKNWAPCPNLGMAPHTPSCKKKDDVPLSFSELSTEYANKKNKNRLFHD